MSRLIRKGLSPLVGSSYAVLCFQVKHSAPDVVANDLRQMMHGAAVELKRAGCALVGGHSGEGSEATLGFSVTGSAQPTALMLKSHVQPGDKMVLTKPLGTGVLLRGAMLRKAHGEHQRAAWESMLQSNQSASVILQDHGVRACTDVTGFGLLGHCVEMAQASQVRQLITLATHPVDTVCLDTFRSCMIFKCLQVNIRINLSSIHMLPGVKELLVDGVQSTAVASNAFYLQYAHQDGSPRTEAGQDIVLDPQTSGADSVSLQFCKL